MEAAAVFEDVFLAIPFGETEIENFFAVGDTTGLSAEAVDEPGKFCECGHLQDSNASDVAFRPVRAGSAGRDRECLSGLGVLADAALCRSCYRGGHNLTSIIQAEGAYPRCAGCKISAG